MSIKLSNSNSLLPTSITYNRRNGVSNVRMNTTSFIQSAGVSWSATSDTYSAPTGFTTGACGIHTGMKRCVLSDAGVVQYYLDPTDSTKKLDGSTANLDGTDGQVMVQIPKFYFKYEYNSPTHTWKISNKQLPGFTLHPAFLKAGVEVDYRYVGAYEGIWYDASADSGNGAYADPDNSDALSTDNTNDKVGSISGEYPIVGITIGTARTLCENRGTGWHQQDWNLTHAIQLLYLTEYGDFNSQESISGGNTNYSSWSTGSGNTRSNESGLSNANGNGSVGVSTAGGSTNDYVTYRGIENFWGNVWKWVDGAIVNPTGDADAWYVADDYTDYADNTTTGYTKLTDSMPADGYVTDIKDVSNGFIPSTTGGTSTTYIGDFFFDDNNNTNRVVRVGGRATDGASAGAFSWIVNIDSSTRARVIGCRLSF